MKRQETGSFDVAGAKVDQESAADLPFNVDELIDPKRWKEVWERTKGQWLDEMRRDGDYDSLASIAASAAILFPERHDLVKAEDREKIAAGVSPANLWGSRGVVGEIFRKADLKTLFTDAVGVVSDVDWNRFKKAIQEASPGYRNAAAAKLRVLSPERSKEITAWGGGSHIELEQNLHYADSPHSPFAAMHYLAMAADLRIAFPQEFEKIKPTPKDWKRLVQGIRSFAGHLHPRVEPMLIRMLAYVKIVAAERVEVTDRGIKCVMPGEKR